MSWHREMGSFYAMTTRINYNYVKNHSKQFSFIYYSGVCFEVYFIPHDSVHL